MWSEDGQVYPATVVCLDGGHCRVRFTGYGNEEDVELSSLLSPEEAPPIPTPTSQVTVCYKKMIPCVLAKGVAVSPSGASEITSTFDM